MRLTDHKLRLLITEAFEEHILQEFKLASQYFDEILADKQFKRWINTYQLEVVRRPEIAKDAGINPHYALTWPGKDAGVVLGSQDEGEDYVAGMVAYAYGVDNREELQEPLEGNNAAKDAGLLIKVLTQVGAAVGALKTRGTTETEREKQARIRKHQKQGGSRFNLEEKK